MIGPAFSRDLLQRRTIHPELGEADMDHVKVFVVVRQGLEICPVMSGVYQPSHHAYRSQSTFCHVFLPSAGCCVQHSRILNRHVIHPDHVSPGEHVAHVCRPHTRPCRNVQHLPPSTFLSSGLEHLRHRTEVRVAQEQPQEPVLRLDTFKLERVARPR